MNYDQLKPKTALAPLEITEGLMRFKVSMVDANGEDVCDAHISDVSRLNMARLRHCYNHFDEAVTLLRELAGSANRLAIAANLSQADGAISEALVFLEKVKEIK